MSRRKRVSKRRWKKRCMIGRMIPATAIADHKLKKWFNFKPIGISDFHLAILKTP